MFTPPARPRTTPRSRLGFTLVELVVVVIIIGVLASLAVIALNSYVGDARDTKTRENLDSLAKTVTVDVLSGDAPAVTAAQMDGAVSSLFSQQVTLGGISGTMTLAAGPSYQVVSHTTVPTSEREFSVGFDDGVDSTADVTSGTGASGVRAAIVTRSPTGKFFAARVLAGASTGSGKSTQVGQVRSTLATPTAACVLDGSCAIGNEVPVAAASSAAPVPCPIVAGPLTVSASNLEFFDLNRDTRTSGHYEFTPDGLHAWTMSNTSLDKVAGYRTGCDLRLADVGTPSMTYVNNGSGVAPGYQLYIKSNKPGGVSGYVVGEPGPYGINWWSNKDFGVGSGMGYTSYAPLAKYLQQNPDATISEFGFSVGSGVKSDGVIKDLTFASTTYTFH